MAQEDRFAALLSYVAHEVTRRQSSEVCCGDLTLEQFQTLKAVSVAEQLSMGVLSAQLRVDLSTMSRNVALLERKGYLQRARDAADGRVVRVRLTAKGKRSLDTLRCDERDVLEDVFERLVPVDRPEVMRALEALRCCLEGAEAAGACCPPISIRRAAS